MAISNDWFIDYQNKLIVHATDTIAFNNGTDEILPGNTIGDSDTPTKTAVVVKVTVTGGSWLGDDAAGTLDIVYVTGDWAATDNIYVGTSKYAEANSDTTTKTTVYTARALYSHIQDTFDELVQMDDTIPMSAQTPTEFTMINGWFIDDESIKFISGGALATSGYTGDIQVLNLDGTYVECVNSDIGKNVEEGGTPRGALLAFNNTTQKWWIRYASTIADNAVMTIDGGIGAGDAFGASDSGEDLYANIYTLGTITTDPKPKTYVFQNGSALAEWWGRGDSLAHIDVLIKVKELDNFIDSGNITVFTRNFGDSYDHFPITLASGGRNAVPLATATDINNNTTGEVTLSYTPTSGTWTVGQFVRDIVTGAYGEILALGSNTLTVGNVILGTGGDFANTDGIQESSDGILNDGDGIAVLNDDPTAVVRGYSDIKIYFVNCTVPYDGGGPTAPTIGETITDVTANPDAIGILLSYTTTGGAWGDSNASGVLTIANWNGYGFSDGDQLNGSVTGADFATANGDETVTATTTKAFEQGVAYPYNVIVNCANRTMAQVYEWFKYVTREDANSTQINFQTMYRVAGSAVVQEDGEEYIAAQSTYSPVKASPFGTLAGGKLFAARGVWVENMATADRQNFQLIDANGSNRTPPNFITITVSSVISGDKVVVFRTSGGTVINKTQFASAAGNNAGDGTFEVATAIPSDTPNTGHIRVVDDSDTSINRESRYAYTSWTGTTFTLSGTTVLDRNYVETSDKAYVPYYDEVAGNTSVYVTVIYYGSQTVLTRVRRYNGSNDSILPFQIAGEVTSAGYTVAAIRTPDTIVT